MIALHSAVVELYRRAATVLPSDVIKAIETAHSRESSGSRAALSLSVILENISSAMKSAQPVCQDTGVPIFFIQAPAGTSHLEISDTIVKATRIATRNVPLRPNAVDILTEKNSGDNTGIGFPIIHYYGSKNRRLIIDLMLKGSGSENIGQLYKLPCEELHAERDWEGVRRCVLNAIYEAQGKGCPPYIIGVGIGATKDQVTRLSKEQLLRRLDDANRYPVLDRLERKILNDVNSLGIGTIGLGGRVTALAVKIGFNHRHPASYFVDVSVACWADRRARLAWDMDKSRGKIQ